MDIQKTIKNNKVVLFMKGNKIFPQCGFSARVVNILDDLNIKYLDVNVLEDDQLRNDIKEFSNWPTIPQLYINGEFVGGCDIVIEMSNTNELMDLLNA